MTHKKQIDADLFEKIKRGLALSFDRLRDETIKRNGELVISRDGKIISVKASDLK